MATIPISDVPLSFPAKVLPKDLKPQSFFELDHSNYEVIFVTESETDPAVPVIRSIIRDKSNAKLAIAGLTKSCAQKITIFLQH